MGHQTVVTEVPAAELEKVLRQRYAERWMERHPTQAIIYDGEVPVGATAQEGESPPEIEGWKDLLAGYQAEGMSGGVAYAASCECGWQANNPLPTKRAAEDDAAAHIASAGGEA